MPTRRRSGSYADLVAATARFWCPPARSFMTVYAQDLMAADTRPTARRSAAPRPRCFMLGQRGTDRAPGGRSRRSWHRDLLARRSAKLAPDPMPRVHVRRRITHVRCGRLRPVGGRVALPFEEEPFGWVGG